MKRFAWVGATQQVHTLLLTYTSGETQCVRWTTQWYVNGLQRAIDVMQTHEKERIALLKRYSNLEGAEAQAVIAELNTHDLRQQVYPLGIWDIETGVFDTPYTHNFRSQGVYAFDLRQVEVTASRTVIADQ